MLSQAFSFCWALFVYLFAGGLYLAIIAGLISVFIAAVVWAVGFLF